MQTKSVSIFDSNIIFPALGDTFRKLNPRLMVKNPVMFVTLVGAAISTVEIFRSPRGEIGFVLQIAIWLWFTVLFANFAEAMAEGRGKAQADSLRKARQDIQAKKLAQPRRDAVQSDQGQGRDQPDDHADGHAHSANAGLAAHHGWVPGDALRLSHAVAF